jgi:hypothetical protein
MCRTVWYNIKWEQINVGDEKGHVVVVGETKGQFGFTQSMVWNSFRL